MSKKIATIVSPEEFVRVWQESESPAEAAKALGLALTTTCVRASRYRMAGVKLKKYSGGRGAPVDADALNKLCK